MSSNYIRIPHEKPWRYKEGNLTVTRGSAWSGPGCHLGCGVLLYTDDKGKFVKCEGDPENPYNQGRLCVRCLDIVESIYNKDRLTYPMKRKKENRGQDKFERITWDEALDTIYDRFTEIKMQYGAETVMFAVGTGRDISQYISRLAWSFGSPNFGPLFSGVACFAPRIAGMNATSGSFWIADCSQQFADRYDNPEYKIPEVMVVWGNYPMISNSDGFYGHWVVDLMKRGTKIVMIDPKVTWLSRHSEVHLRVRPGTDAALALGILNVIINEGIYDHEFVEKWCFGFDELAERVQEYSTDKIAEICWVPEEKIITAARLIANAKPATLQWGVAVDQTKEALPASQAMMAIFQITGNIEKPGSLIRPPELLNYIAGWGADLVPEETQPKRIGASEYPLFSMGFTIYQPDAVIDTLITDKPYKMRAAWLQTTNPLACTGADPKRVYEGFSKLDFIVVVDLYMTPTAMALADIILPAATYPERNGIRIGDGAQRGETINKVIEPIGECRSDMEINLELGKRFNPEAWPWDTVEDMYTSILQDTEMTFEEMQQEGPVYIPFEYNRHEKGLLRFDGQPGFNTPTGKIELWSTFYAQAGYDPLPYFEEPSPGPGATPELLNEYPLVLTTGARRWSMFHSEHRQVPRMRDLHKYPTIEVHPNTLERFGLQDGDWVWVENYMGRAKRKISATPIFDERIVACDHGWWLPESDPENLYDVFDYNINNLLPWDPGKTGFGSNYKTTLVKLYKVTPENDENFLSDVNKVIEQNNKEKNHE